MIDRVLRRSRPPGALAAVAAAALIVTGLAGTATPTRTSTVDPKLVGKWARTVTKADVKRAHGFLLLAGHVVKLSIAKGGRWTLDEGFEHSARPGEPSSLPG